jgi:hypothetical protein
VIRIDILEHLAWRLCYGTLSVGAAVACCALARDGRPFLPFAVLGLLCALASTLCRFVEVSGTDAELRWSLLGYGRAVRFVLGEVAVQRSRRNATRWWLVFRDSEGKGRCQARVSEARMRAVEQHAAGAGMGWVVIAPGVTFEKDSPRS